MIGFDLTAVKPAPSRGPQVQQRSYVYPNQNQPQTPPPEPAALKDPNAPKDLNDALTRPVNSNLTVEDREAGISGVFKDKRPPEFKKAHWGIDKFAETTPRVVQTKVIDPETKLEKTIYIDANGNMPVDPATGRVLTKARPATTVDKKEINAK